jgi:aryl-phospho-beta-D-glucosidase BglC (GH1 family)
MLLQRQVEPCDISNYYRLKLHLTDAGKHYNVGDNRPDVFWRLDEMCQHEYRRKAEGSNFSYMFTREWADHMQNKGICNTVQDPWRVWLVPVSKRGVSGKPVTAAEARDAPALKQAQVEDC